MITCTIIIKELPDGHLALAMDPKNDNPTSKEVKFASIVDTGLNEIFQYALRMSQGEELIEGYNLGSRIKAAIERHNR